MRRMAPMWSVSLAVTAALTLAGCHAPRSDMNVAVAADYAVVVDAPLVQVDHDVVNITGTLHRNPGASGELTGRIDIDFVDSEGDVLQEATALFTPSRVPLDPKASSSYHLSYGYAFPAGTTVQVRFVDSETAARETADHMQYGSNGTKNVGGGGGIHSKSGGFGRAGTGGGGGGGRGRW